ncbi:MAG: ABC transporter ATP-binding protein [Pseudorhodoplanes sp.]
MDVDPRDAGSRVRQAAQPGGKMVASKSRSGGDEMMREVIGFENVKKSFAQRQESVTAIEKLSFSIGKGEYVCVLGRSGCGKSTMINLLLGLSSPTAGAVRVSGLDPYNDFDALRGRIGCVFQNDRLLPWRTALENAILPLELKDHAKAQHHDRGERLLARLGLSKFVNAYPHELSGGMRQRVAIARAIASGPEILLADEPFGHLDAATGSELREEFREIWRRDGTTVFHVTHSIDEAIELATRIIVLAPPGQIVAEYDLAEQDRDHTTLRREIASRIH